MIDEEFTKGLLAKHSFLSERESIDCLTLDLPSGELISFLVYLKTEESFDMLVDLTAIDHGEGEKNWFSTVIHLYSLSSWVCSDSCFLQ